MTSESSAELSSRARRNRWRQRGLSAMLVVVGVPGLIVLTQDVQIYPRAFDRSASKFKEPLPEGVESIFFESSDGCRLEAWRREAHPEAGPAKGWFLLVHGNGDTIERFHVHQEVLAAAGWGSYSLDYRGFGRADCWPSEKGSYRDVDAFLDLAKSREGEARYVLVGYSLGTGIAAHGAVKHPGMPLVLVAPYLSIPDVVKIRPWVWPLAPLLWTRFPTKDRVPEMGDRRLLIVASQVDQVIPYDHATALRDLAEKSRIPVQLLTLDHSSHGSVIGDAWPQILAWAAEAR